jgi:hypothetical protein
VRNCAPHKEKKEPRRGLPIPFHLISSQIKLPCALAAVHWSIASHTLLSLIYRNQIGTVHPNPHSLHNLQFPSPTSPSATQHTLPAMSQTAFFYGTLMAPPVLHRVIYGPIHDPTQATPLRTRPALLPSYQRHKVRGADYPAILPSSTSTSSVRGTLVEGLTEGDVWRLDVFEGDEYERVGVKVRVLKPDGKEGNAGVDEEGEEVEAETYVWIAGASRLEPEEWDFSEFVRDKMKRWVGREAAETDEGFQGRPSINGEFSDPSFGHGRRESMVTLTGTCRCR